MKNSITLQIIPVLVLILSFGITCLAQTTEFTYQGYLNDNSQPANGNYDFEFSLFDALEGGTQIGGTLARTGITVSEGKFTVRLDFGAVFPGANRYLEISVRQSVPPAAGNEVTPSFTALSPRQTVTSAPYSVKSLYASNAENADNATTAITAINADNATTAINATNADNATTAANAIKLGGVNADQYVLTTDPRMTDARPPMGGSAWYVQNRTTQQASSNFNVSGIGRASIIDVLTHYSITGNRVLSTLGTDNLFAGVGAGRTNGTGYSNTFVGTEAGYSNSAGNVNSFFGYKAGNSNSTGSQNSFFGNRAGLHNTTGASNSFFGSAAGLSNAIGQKNSFFGSAAGRWNKSDSNSFFGYAAGYWNSTGSNNSFFGSNAGYENTTGFDNSFFGKGAGENNQTIGSDRGSYNTFIGRDAGNANTTGIRNTVVGAYAFDLNETGRDNTVVGIYAGGIAGGNDNSFFGRFAGYATVGNYNTFVGSGTGGTNVAGNYNTTLGGSSDVASGGLTFATAIGAGSKVSASATVQLGRDNFDTVRIGKLGAAGSTSLCQNASKEIATCSSSIRYKSNIDDFRSGLDLIRKLRPVSFKWKDSGAVDVGLVAEEVEKIEPLLATRNQDDQIEGVNYDRLGVVLVNAVKEQQTRIEKQKEKGKRHDEMIVFQQKQIDRQQETIDRHQQRLKQQEAEIKALKRLVCSQNKEANICQ